MFLHQSTNGDFSHRPKAQGQPVFESPAQNGMGMEIGHGLPSGAYILQLDNGKERVTKTVVKMK